MEFRIKDCQLQANEDGSLKVGGYINVTERESEMLFNKKNGKWFKEIMKQGVFKRAIESARTGIPLLFEHNWDKQLATTDDCSLTLKEDNVGLKFEATIKDESIYEQVRTGIINSCSFGFRALAEEVEAINTRLEKRVVNAIELLEVSLVKNPAYVGSLCETRSYEEELQEEERAKCDTEEKREDSTDVDSKSDSEKETEDKPEVEEEKEASEEVIEEEKEDLAEEKVEDSEEEKEESDKRFNEVESLTSETTPTIEKDYIVGIVNELIDSKLSEIKVAETVEEIQLEEVEHVKEIHKDIESDMEEQVALQNMELIKLRLELLKLKQIKEGI